MVTLLPTNPLPAAELAVVLCPRDMPVADLRAACDLVRLYSRDRRALARGRVLAEQIDMGRLV